jgi:hypothetical protein
VVDARVLVAGSGCRPQLRPREQELVFAAVLEAIVRTAPPHPLKRNAEVAIEAVGCTALEFWQEALADAGFDKCEPWEGWPQRSAILPESERIDLSELPIAATGGLH